MSKTPKSVAALSLLSLLALLAPAATRAQSRHDARPAAAESVSYSRSFARGVEHFDAGRYEEALEAFLRAVSVNPRDPDALFDAGAAYEKLGRPLEAAAAYRSALELRPASPKARARLCSSLVAAGQFWDAVGACGNAVRREPTDPELYALYGSAFAGSGLHDQAAEAFRQAVRLRPHEAAYHLALGLAFERLGEYRDALDSLARAARLDPGLARARAEQARVTAELADLEGALPGVGGPDRLLNVGHAYRLKGWFGQAAAVYAFAAGQSPRDARPHYYLGLAHYSMNRYQRAQDSYRRALALDPKIAEARQAIAWLTAFVSGRGGADGARPPAAAAAQRRRGAGETAAGSREH